MSWKSQEPLKWYHKFVANILKCGPVPKHIAIIMDGNRRYAVEQNVDRIKGHRMGFGKLTETLQWCEEFNINEVTVYAFSIENFSRSEDEVMKLMELATEKYEEILEEKEKLIESGVCMRIIGNWDLIPQKLRKSMTEVVLQTKNNTKAFLNVAFAYTSQDEVANALELISNGLSSKSLDESDVNQSLISNLLHSRLSSDPEILIRTSGEVRLSDFLLWQMGYTQLIFTKVLWPDFTIWNFIAIIFHYQRNYQFKARKAGYGELTDNAKQFIEMCNSDMWKQLETYIYE